MIFGRHPAFVSVASLPCTGSACRVTGEAVQEDSGKHDTGEHLRNSGVRISSSRRLQQHESIRIGVQKISWILTSITIYLVLVNFYLFQNRWNELCF
jgi:hypothetical protein